jgi:hypothetical protein
VHETRANLARRERQVPRPIAVDAPRKLRFALGTIDSRTRGGVHDHIRRMQADATQHCPFVGHIQTLVGALHDLDRRWSTVHQRPADLASDPGDQDFHGKYSASRKRAATTSFAERTGSSPDANGHSMLRSGSFQRIARSCVGE